MNALPAENNCWSIFVIIIMHLHYNISWEGGFMHLCEKCWKLILLIYNIFALKTSWFTNTLSKTSYWTCRSKDTQKQFENDYPGIRQSSLTSVVRCYYVVSVFFSNGELFGIYLFITIFNEIMLDMCFIVFVDSRCICWVLVYIILKL